MPLVDDLTFSGFGSDFSADNAVVLGQIVPPFKFLREDISVILCVTPKDG